MNYLNVFVGGAPAEKFRIIFDSNIEIRYNKQNFSAGDVIRSLFLDYMALYRRSPDKMLSSALHQSRLESGTWPSVPSWFK